MTTFNVLRTLCLAAALITTVACEKNDAAPATAQLDTAAEQKAIQQLLNDYGAALNASDADKASALFAPDAVFIAPASPTATGQTQIRGAFTGLFGAVTLNLQFTPAQIVVANATSAYATSTSNGTLTPRGGAAIPSFYRELWAFTKEEGQWKIARYMFNQP
ncbi:MAG: SgcJ/EcaC family oxidoreductase [Hymenobacter sp.]|nr:SgcJ/EcaC family oxidoreductase [Hymenobacter sp.]